VPQRGQASLEGAVVPRTRSTASVEGAVPCHVAQKYSEHMSSSQRPNGGRHSRSTHHLWSAI